MKLTLTRVQLHGGLFLGGANLTEKLDTKQRKGLTLEYDREAKELMVTYNGEAALVPYGNIAYIPLPKDEPLAPLAPAPPPTRDAQVETPHSHVFAGEGHGQTGQSGKIKVR